MLRRFFTISGRATPSGTYSFSSRNQSTPESNWRKLNSDLTISSIGLGTYIGAPDNETDDLVEKAIYSSVSSGCLNHIDTAINYRYQKAERSVGRAISKLISEGFSRSELILSSKIGYIPEDADNGVPGSSVINDLIQKKLIESTDVAGKVHCMHPAFLEDQLSRSLNNLQVDTLDILYLHNTAEAQLPLVGQEEYEKRLAKAFEFCENKVKEGKIAAYGMASWICFRSPIKEKDLHVSLEKVVNLVKSVAGDNNNFKVVQLPINLMMPEAFISKWQEFNAKEEIFLNVAKEMNVDVVSSSPLLQGKIVELKLAKSLVNIDLQACKHLQIIRSIPSKAIKSTLVGMKNPRNVAQNLQVAKVDCLTAEEFWNVLKPEGKENAPVVIDLW
jgi:aryl-alcohol dehydrogenase-like predicted oxidoreductase